MNHRQACEDYLRSRTGKYEWRCIRYAAVADRMFEHGLNDDDIVIDIGAGWCEFDHYLRTDRGWCGRYMPLDGSIDGTDLNLWQPKVEAAFFVAIELLEHLRDPWRVMTLMEMYATKAVAATTPNPRTTDVLGMDPTHVIEIHEEAFQVRGWQTEERSFYGQENDSILAWKGVSKGRA